MEFIGLFKCNFCPSSLHDLESLITHFSVQHLNKELFECESCCIKFWKIPDYYEHRNNSNSTCSKFGISMKSFFNIIKICFDSKTTAEDDLSGEYSLPTIDQSLIKTENINEENSLDVNFPNAENLSKRTESLKLNDNLINNEEGELSRCIEDESCILEDKFDSVSLHSSIFDETYLSKTRKLKESKNVKRIGQRKSKRIKYFKETKRRVKIDKRKIATENEFNNENQNSNSVENNTNVKCKVCGKYFDNCDKLRIHFKIHNLSEKLICHICDKVFNIFSNLATHILSKHQENLFCIKCNKNFITQENFQLHINELHKIKRNRKKNDSKKLECFECIGKIFTRVSTFVMHLANKHKKSDDEIKQILEVNNEAFKNELMCKICGKLFATVEHFRKHQKKKHGDDGSKKYKCKSCPKFFTTQDEVRHHTLDYHKQKLICQICNTGKIYACTESLTSHMRKIHNTHISDQNNSDDAEKKSTKIYKFICGQCGKIMYGRTQFKNHEASNCGKNPVHKCHICGKGFASAGTLKGHISIHEDYESYQFVCDFCQKRYRSKHQLEKHRRVHTGERPFQCPHCERAFGTSAALFVHVSTHTGIKRYMCTCGERFSCITGLKGHWKTNFATCGSDPNRSTKPVGEYIGYRKGKIVNIRPEEEMMMRPSL